MRATAFQMKKGSILMEFVLTMPILFMLIMLVLQFAQIMVVRQFVAYAAFCSTRSMLCSNPSEFDSKNPKQFQCTHQAARRVLAWVNIFGTPETAHLRGWEEGYAEVGAGDFSDIGDKSTESYVTMMYGSSETHDVLVPGWGQIPESNSIDRRLEVEYGPRGFDGRFAPNGKYAYSTVRYKFPLLIPIAGQMISFLAKHSAEESLYVKSKASMSGWTGEEELFDGVPYIELTETCVLPLPYSTVNLPGGNSVFGVGTAFDYTSYD